MSQGERGRMSQRERAAQELVEKCNHTSFAKVDPVDVHGACAKCIAAALKAAEAFVAFVEREDPGGYFGVRAARLLHKEHGHGKATPGSEPAVSEVRDLRDVEGRDALPRRVDGPEVRGECQGSQGNCRCADALKAAERERDEWERVARRTDEDRSLVMAHLRQVREALGEARALVAQVLDGTAEPKVWNPRARALLATLERSDAAKAEPAADAPTGAPTGGDPREALVCALERLYAETADDIRINNLGRVHHNTAMQMARDALIAAASTVAPAPERSEAPRPADDEPRGA